MKKQICILLCLAAALNAIEPLKAQCSRDDSKDIVVCKDAIHGTLTWQDSSDNVVKKWKDAKEYCDNLNYAGYIGWRLPTRTELLSIVDYDVNFQAINNVFKNAKSSWYWSSTLDVKNPSYVQYVDFSCGYTGNYNPHHSIYVRCVRQ